VPLGERAVVVDGADRTVQQRGDGRRVGDAQADQRVDAQHGGQLAVVTPLGAGLVGKQAVHLVDERGKKPEEGLVEKRIELLQLVVADVAAGVFAAEFGDPVVAQHLVDILIRTREFVDIFRNRLEKTPI